MYILGQVSKLSIIFGHQHIRLIETLNNTWFNILFYLKKDSTNALLKQNILFQIIIPQISFRFKAKAVSESIHYQIMCCMWSYYNVKCFFLPFVNMTPHSFFYFNGKVKTFRQVWIKCPYVFWGNCISTCNELSSDTITVLQGSSTPVLQGHCPAEFSSNPNQTRCLELLANYRQVV